MDDKSSTTMQAAPPPHVVIVPLLGMGHLIPLVEFAKRLLPEFIFTFAVPTDGPPSSAYHPFLSSLPSGIDSVFIPSADLSDTPSDAKFPTLFALSAYRSVPYLRKLISDLLSAGSRVVALVVDVFGTDAFDFATEFGICPYIFVSSSAMFLSLILHLEQLDETTSCEYGELDEAIKVPGCVPIHGRDFFDPLLDRKNDAYKWTLHHAHNYKLAEGIILNSFEALEVGTFAELLQPESGKPPVYAVGPLIRSSSGDDGSECLKWLDEQQRGSVLYVNFGSGGTLSSEQQNQLALGLEMSGQRFLWVVRTPNDSMDGEPDPLKSVPEGFLERTKGRGYLVAEWAPQIKILSHGSTGGFLSHCGWNSTLESVVYGVPLITYALYHEQNMNTVIITEELKVGLRPKVGEDGVVKKDEISRVVKELMIGDEGKRIQMKMKKFQDAAGVPFSNNGSSTKVLKELSQKWNTV